MILTISLLYYQEKYYPLTYRISPALIITTGAIQNATIIYSNYGVLVRDNDNQRTWLYIQNTPESREKFAQVRACLIGDIASSEIAGIIRIRTLIS